MLHPLVSCIAMQPEQHRNDAEDDAMTVETQRGAAGGMRTIEDLRGPAGRLEALLNPGRGNAAPPLAVLLCHPHPLHGGTLHNKVVYHAMKAFIELGLPVLRFNFRGTGRSEGAHDAGRGEQDDARVALDWLDREFGLPILAAGFSFRQQHGAAGGLCRPSSPGNGCAGCPG